MLFAAPVALNMDSRHADQMIGAKHTDVDDA